MTNDASKQVRSSLARQKYNEELATKPQRTVTFHGWLTSQVYQSTEFEKIARIALAGGAMGQLKGTFGPVDLERDIDEAFAAHVPSVDADDVLAVKKLKKQWREDKRRIKEELEEANAADRDAISEREAAFASAQEKFGSDLVHMHGQLLDENPSAATIGLTGQADEPHGSDDAAAADPDSRTALGQPGVGLTVGASSDVAKTRRTWAPSWYGPDGAPLRCTWMKPGSHYQCRRYAVAPTARCEIHGGLMIDQQKMTELVSAASTKLVAAADMAVDVLIELAQHSTNDLVRVRAAEDILDRAGLQPGITVDVNVTMQESPASIIAERLDRLAEFALPSAKIAVEPALDDDVEEAEVVDES